jgi:hypothetical protein
VADTLARGAADTGASAARKIVGVLAAPDGLNGAVVCVRHAIRWRHEDPSSDLNWCDLDPSIIGARP